MELFVLGAGFSRAFNSRAPLMQGFLAGYEDLLTRPNYSSIADFCRKCRLCPAELNIETLFTLLSLPRPWMERIEDAQTKLTGEAVRLLIEEVLTSSFSRAIAANGTFTFTVEHEESLVNFGKYLCLSPDAQVITFNYDLLLDHFLERIGPRDKRQKPTRQFQSRRSYGLNAMKWDMEDMISSPHHVFTSDSHLVNVIKLHGSINWLQSATALEKITEADLCIEGCCQSLPSTTEVRSRFRQSKFIVPPNLDKTATARNPVLSLLWNRAATILSSAQSLIFIGYGFPATDFHAEFLFRYYAHPDQVLVVSKRDPTPEERTLIEARYRSLFPNIPVSFQFDGAEDFCGTLGLPNGAGDLLHLLPPVPRPRLI